MWIDCHAHIDSLPVSEQEQVLKRAREVGVRWMINASDDLESCGRVRLTAARFPEVYGNMGIHPHHAHTVTEETYKAVAEGLSDPKIIGVGEIGLDFYRENSPREVQIQVFERFMELALERQKPVVVHHRDSSAETVQAMRKFCGKGLRGMIHCFSGTWDFAKEALDMGLYLSFSGILTFKNAKDIQDVAAKAPADRILVETDSPYLAPVPVRGQTNEPKNLVFTAERLAALRGMTPEALSRQTMANAERLFGISLTERAA